MSQEKKKRFYTVSEKADHTGRMPKFGEAMLIVLAVLALLVWLIPVPQYFRSDCPVHLPVFVLLLRRIFGVQLESD